MTRYDEPGAGDGYGGPHPLKGVSQRVLDAATEALRVALPDLDEGNMVEPVAHAILLAAREAQGIPSQAEVLAWVAERWPDHTSVEWRAMKAGEEAGEILGAVIKEELGLKPPGTIAMESAQAVLCIMGLAEAVGFDLWDAVAADWQTMQTRTWPPSDEDELAAAEAALEAATDRYRDALAKVER